MKRLATLIVAAVLTSSCAGVQAYQCTTGREGVEAAATYAAEHWPDAREDATHLLVSCKPQEVLATSISSCGLSNVKRPESCAVHKAAPGRPARIDVSHDEDAAIATCHELQHLRDAVWFTTDGCQSHDLETCGYDTVAVERCEEAVRTFRSPQ